MSAGLRFGRGCPFQKYSQIRGLTSRDRGRSGNGSAPPSRLGRPFFRILRFLRGCRFRKLDPPEWRLFPNQNMILCVPKTSSALIGPCESLSGVILGLTLTAHGHLGICLACAFQDGWPFCHRFVSAQDDLDVERIKLEASAASAGLFAGDEGRSRTEEWVDDDVAAFG
jgi:hypothetical protein